MHLESGRGGIEFKILLLFYKQMLHTKPGKDWSISY